MSNNRDDDNKESRTRLYAQVDKIEDKVDSIDVTMARNTALLEEHIRRTNILEDELKPIKEHVAVVKGGLAWLKIIAQIGGAMGGLAAIGAALKVLLIR